MKVGIEISSSLVSNPTGVQRYITGVINGLAECEKVDITRLIKISRWRKRGHIPRSNLPTVWYTPSLGFCNKSLEVIHCMDPTIPWYSGDIPVVVTIHDLYLARHAPDLSIDDRKRKLKRILKACRIASHIVVPTDAIKAELASVVGNEKPITAIPHGVAEEFFIKDKITHPDQQLRKPYILGFCGGQRKNFTGLVSAFRESNLMRLGWNLVAVGDLSSGEHKKYSEILGSERLRLKNNISDKHLIELYAGAGGTCYPSYYEGFGFPILESMAAGVPIVTSNFGAAAEISDGKAILVNPYSISDIARGLNEITEVGPMQLKKNKKYAENFQWACSGKKLLEVYQSL